MTRRIPAKIDPAPFLAEPTISVWEERDVSPPSLTLIDDALRDLAVFFATGYRRLLGSRGCRRPTADSASNREKSLDLSVEQSDELAMSALLGGRRV